MCKVLCSARVHVAGPGENKHGHCRRRRGLVMASRNNPRLRSGQKHNCGASWLRKDPLTKAKERLGSVPVTRASFCQHAGGLQGTISQGVQSTVKLDPVAWPSLPTRGSGAQTALQAPGQTTTSDRPIKADNSVGCRSTVVLYSVTRSPHAKPPGGGSSLTTTTKSIRCTNSNDSRRMSQQVLAMQLI